jgi:RNA polymerase sigma-70 factor (ECF subfamily)
VHVCVRAIVRHPATARGIAERVFAELPDRIAWYQPREVPFDVWLLGIATEAAIGRADHETPTNGAAPAGEPERDAPRRQAARDAVLRLPPDERCVLVLRHLVGLPVEQLAARLRKSEGAVRRLDERGRVALRAGLRESADRSAVA